MTDQEIRFCTTSDGVSIAFWTMGEGEPFLWMPMPIMSHILLDWQRNKGEYERLAEHRTLIRYDCCAELRADAAARYHV